MRRTLRTMLLIAAPALFAGCDNVGRAFDPDVTPPDPGPSAPSTIQVPPVRGDVRDGRPVVRAAYPKAGGWPATVPIVVEFSESMNESSIVPTTTGGLDGKVILRVQGTTTALPCVYDFLGGGRLLVMRPLSGLTGPTGASFEVAMLPGVRDADGVQVVGTTEQILATFTVDTASTSEDGKILAVFPRDNVRDLSLDTELIVVFTKPANAAPFLQPGNFVVRTAAGVAVPGLPEAPLPPADTRVVRFRPTVGEFAPGTGHEFVVTNGITFGQAGVLDFGNRTPFSRFTTSTLPQPLGVKVGNPTLSFENKVNRSNLPTLQMSVDVPADALAGDRVVVRVYGLDRQTHTTGDLGFVERSTVLAAGGAQTVSVDFAGRIGSVTNTRFEDGLLSFVTQLQRGSNVHSGIVVGANDALQDTIAPTLVSISGPVDANGTDLLTELEDVVVSGTASEQLGDLQLTAGGAPVHLFGSRPNGTFVSGPLPIGRRTSPVALSLAIFDRAGNEAAAPVTGNVVQRGVITGSSAGGDLTVEAYDDATMRALAGVTVFVDPGAPTFPAAAGRVTATTGAAGRAVFTGLTAGPQSITLILDGYDPVTLYTTTVGYASLPLRPSTPLRAVATFSGTATPETALAGASAIVGNNLFDDPKVIAVRTGTAVPLPIPPTAIVPNRLQVVTGFGGVFEPTANPAFAFHACNLLGGDVATPSAPPALVPAAGISAVTLLLRERSTNFANLGLLSGSAAVDFSQSVSLNTNNLTPVVRFLTALDGFRGQVATGVGFGSGSPVVTVTGSYSSAILDGLVAFHPRTWATIEVEDAQGSVCRIRRRVDTTTASGTDFVHPQWIPVIGLPGGPSTGPPLVTVFEALDAALVTGTGVPVLAVLDVVARNAAGREWRIIAEDTDPRATGASDDFQFPDPGTQTGLGTGDWVVRASARLFLKDTRQAGDFALADRLREELSFTRGSVVTFTVQ